MKTCYVLRHLRCPDCYYECTRKDTFKDNKVWQQAVLEIRERLRRLGATEEMVSAVSFNLFEEGAGV